MSKSAGRDGIAFADAAAWEAWLADHHADASELWLKLAKKGSKKATVSQAEALESAICFGWIDGKAGRLDDDCFLQRFTPRTRRSRWSRINCAKAEALIAQARMRPAGLREVERAKADGRWDAAYAGARTIEVPDDLRRELDARPDAAASFAGLDGQTVTRSSTGSRTRRGRRRAQGGSRSSWRCWRRGRRFTRRAGARLPDARLSQRA